MKQNIFSQLREIAATSGQPVTLRHKTGAIEAFLPNGETLLCAEVATIPRNKSHFVATGAARYPGTLFKVSNNLCTAWYVWMDSALHGQYHSESDAIDAIAA